MRVADKGVTDCWAGARRARRASMDSTAGAHGRRRPTFARVSVLTIAALVAAAGYGGTAYASSKLQVLFSFRDMRGYTPQGGLVSDAAGNLFGTTTFGGKYDAGVAFELSPPVDGKAHWTQTVLHAFTGADADGGLPDSTLVRDSAGNLYGVTEQGGPSQSGAVFELSPPKGGQTHWTEKILHFFNVTDGYVPAASLIFDEAGNIYGTTNDGGTGTGPNCGLGCGVVFELSPPAQGRQKWTETVLHSFNQTEGLNPAASLFRDGAGNLYGTTAQGGPDNDGVVYELSPPTGDHTAWTETMLHAFNGADGQFPASSLIADGAGNFYGTTEAGGPHSCPIFNCGVVYELSPPVAGGKAWTETVLRGFNGRRGDESFGGLLMDGAGNLYGTAAEGGRRGCSPDGCGLVFELSPPAAGKTIWTEKVLHIFNGANGHYPHGNLLMDGAGDFYGMTDAGGTHDDGVAFKLTP